MGFKCLVSKRKKKTVSFTVGAAPFNKFNAFHEPILETSTQLHADEK